MIDLNSLWARTLVRELALLGVREAVVCPGSRSTPLALACAEELPRVYSIVDERSAAFFALGCAKATGRPALVVATSGTAGAHFFPALLEAEASCVPLIALTADRPHELHGWGAPQTIDQQRLFGEHVRFFADLGLPEHATLPHLRATAARAFARATQAPRGPVHLNAPFREPLAPQAGASTQLPAQPPAVLLQPSPLVPSVLEAARALSGRRRGVIVCGPRDLDDGLPAAVAQLAARLGYAVIAEPASQVRYALPDSIAHADSIVRALEAARRLRPDAIVRIGGGLTSKALQAFLDESFAYTICLSDDGAVHDPQHRAALVLVGNAAATCAALAASLEKGPASEPAKEPGQSRARSFAQEFAEADALARAALDRAFDDAAGALTEPAIAREVALGAGEQLFVSSSMPVRDLDSFAARGAPGLRVLANRGANGIDGIVSTALGAAAASGKRTTLLTGDLALLHDSGGLLAARRLGVPLTIVVVNNDGGGIFSFLPVAAATPRFEELFGTPHGLDLAHLAALAGAHFARPTTAPALRAALRDASGLSLIELRTDRRANVEVHRALHARVAAALEALAEALAEPLAEPRAEPLAEPLAEPRAEPRAEPPAERLAEPPAPAPSPTP